MKLLENTRDAFNRIIFWIIFFLKKNIKVDGIINFFIWLFSVIIVFIASIFFTLKIYQFFFVPRLTEVNFTGPISSEVVLSLLAIVLAFAGAINYFFYKVIERDIKEKAEEKLREERKISKADVTIVLSYFHICLYETLYKEKTESKDEDGEAKKEIDKAILHIQKAIEFLKGIEEEKCLRQIFLTKNNLSYFLARKWNYFKDNRGDADFKEYLEENKARAMEYRVDKRLSEGNVEYLKNKKASEKYPDLATDVFEDTFSWVDKIFSVDPEVNP